MSVRSVLQRARRVALTRMLDACVVRREDLTRVDSKTGLAALVDVATSRCHLDSLASQEATADVVGQQVTVQRRVLKLPVTVPPLRIDDLVEITASATDSAVVGRTFRVTGIPSATQASSHRYSVEEVTS
ncbi:hypothetical protein JT358_11585 [Micrococcales bacterium 31B]|nr:hypothetical protein [Micrococcales bacterium 31B]